MDARAGTPMDMAEFVCLALWEEQCTSAVIPPYLILQVAKKFVQTETAQKIMFIGVTGEKVSETLSTGLRVILKDLHADSLVWCTIITVISVKNINISTFCYLDVISARSWLRL